MIAVNVTEHFRRSWEERVGGELPVSIITQVINAGFKEGRARIKTHKDLNILVEIRHDSLEAPVFIAGKFDSNKFVAMTVLRREDACAMGWNRSAGPLKATLGEINGTRKNS